MIGRAGQASLLIESEISTAAVDYLQWRCRWNSEAFLILPWCRRGPLRLASAGWFFRPRFLDPAPEAKSPLIRDLVSWCFVWLFSGYQVDRLFGIPHQRQTFVRQVDQVNRFLMRDPKIFPAGVPAA